MKAKEAKFKKLEEQLKEAKQQAEGISGTNTKLSNELKALSQMSNSLQKVRYDNNILESRLKRCRQVPRCNQKKCSN